MIQICTDLEPSCACLPADSSNQQLYKIHPKAVRIIRSGSDPYSWHQCPLFSDLAPCHGLCGADRLLTRTQWAGGQRAMMSGQNRCGTVGWMPRGTQRVYLWVKQYPMTPANPIKTGRCDGGRDMMGKASEGLKMQLIELL